MTIIRQPFAILLLVASVSAAGAVVRPPATGCGPGELGQQDTNEIEEQKKLDALEEEQLAEEDEEPDCD